MTLPNFVVIGAAKSGTTTLYHALAQHPQVFMCPVKEPRFFEFDGLRPEQAGPYDDYLLETSVFDLDAYRQLFAGVTAEIAVGEVSPGYLASETAAESIQKYVPHARLIAILRNPADRAYSHYMMKVRDGVENVSFEEALRREPERIRNGWRVGRYVERGFYYQQLKRYYARFRREQIHVFLFEEFQANPAGTMQSLFEFLGVDPGVTVDLATRYNASGMVRNPLLHFLWVRSRWLRRRLRPALPAAFRRAAYQRVTRNLVTTPLAPDVREALLEQYRPDIELLQELLERDLSVWWQPRVE